MKKSLFLYLFIVAVLMNVFTYKYFSEKNKSEIQSESVTNKKLHDSIVSLNKKLVDVNYFSLENDDRALNLLNEDVNKYSERVKQALLAYNDDKAGNKFTGQIMMGEQKYIINDIKLLNHRWLIADYSNGELWGEVLLKYFINEDGSVDFQMIDSYLYPKETY